VFLGGCALRIACSAYIRLALPYRAETPKLASLQKRRPNWTSLQPAVASVGRLLGCARFVTIQKRRPGRTSQHIVTNGSAAVHTAAPAGAKLFAHNFAYEGFQCVVNRCCIGRVDLIAFGNKVVVNSASHASCQNYVNIM